ncbi:MAG: hypothetical protein MZU97_18240 [Bacillus subtilis]|nr:hypothetical protein [Bacillus subtilis]
MRSEDITVAIISGGGGIYEASGATLIGRDVHEYSIDVIRVARRNESPSSQRIEDSDLPSLIEIDRNEPLRFVRGADEFADLLAGQTHSGYVRDVSRIDLIESNGRVVAYAIGVLNVDNQELGWKEYAGDRPALVASMRRLTQLAWPRKIHFAADPTDPIASLLAASPTPIGQFASFRILDAKRLFSLLAKFALMRGVNTWSDMEILNDQIHYHGETISNSVEPRLEQAWSFRRSTIASTGRSAPTLHALWKRVFPLPFPWTHNLNYQ